MNVKKIERKDGEKTSPLSKGLLVAAAGKPSQVPQQSPRRIIFGIYINNIRTTGDYCYFPLHHVPD